MLVAAVLHDPSAPVSAQSSSPRGSSSRNSSFTVARRDFVKSVRLSGTVEAIQAITISTPRLAGPNSGSLVITRLVRPGSAVQAGQAIVEFDRQQQLTNALDRRAELKDLEQQIRKREAQERAAAARDEGEIKTAESTQARAELEMVKNDMIPKIKAEKNTNALEQARATLKQLNATYELKRKAAEADLRILRIRRDRAENAMRQAESNAERMAIKAPIGGMAVLRTVWKSNNMAEVQEGEEVRAGMPIVDIVNPNAMRVRAKVNQADINELRIGQTVAIGLDAYPELHFPGRDRADLADRHHLDALAEGAAVHRADRRRGLASEPDAGPDRVARRRARAGARDRWSCRATRSGTTASARSSGCSAARASRSAGDGDGDERARGRGLGRASTKAPSSPGTSRPGAVDEPGGGAAVASCARARCGRARRAGGGRRVRQRRARRGAGPRHRRRGERGVRRCAGDSRRHPAAQVDRAGVADAVRRAADREARQERHRRSRPATSSSSSTPRRCAGRCRRSSRSCGRRTRRSSRRARRAGSPRSRTPPS